MIFVRLVDDDLRLHEIRIAVEVATGQLVEPRPFRLVNQGRVQSDDGAAALVPVRDRQPFCFSVEQRGQFIGIIENENLIPFEPGGVRSLGVSLMSAGIPASPRTHFSQPSVCGISGCGTNRVGEHQHTFGRPGRLVLAGRRPGKQSQRRPA